MLDIFYWIRKVINVRSINFLPPVIIPAVILLEGFLCNNCSCSINHNWFFLNHMCGAVCGIAIICQHDINKRFWPFWVKGNNNSFTSQTHFWSDRNFMTLILSLVALSRHLFCTVFCEDCPVLHLVFYFPNWQSIYQDQYCSSGGK